jgi:hypothetical protein
MTGSATRKPRLVGGVEGRIEKKGPSVPGSPALWAGSFTLPLVRKQAIFWITCQSLIKPMLRLAPLTAKPGSEGSPLPGFVYTP